MATRMYAPPPPQTATTLEGHMDDLFEAAGIYAAELVGPNSIEYDSLSEDIFEEWCSAKA